MTENRVFSLCFTGMSGSGKTTLANALSQRLKAYSIPLQVIDGDQLREEMGNLFGYTRQERMKNSRVVRLLARYLNQNGISVIIAVVAPYQEMREQFRDFLGNSFVQVYVKCPYAECAARDVKGYYKKQQAGQMENLNGADDVFEEPQCSEIVVDTKQSSVGECADKIICYLEENGYAVPVHHGR